MILRLFGYYTVYSINQEEQTNRTAGPGLGVSLLSDSTVFSSALVTGQTIVIYV